MFNNFNPFQSESKDNIMIKIDIQGQMSEEGAKEVAKITNEKVGEGKKWFLIFVGFGLGFAILCLGISLIKWW